MIAVFPEIRSPCDLIAEMCSPLPMRVTSCRWERRPPKKLPIAPAPNTRSSTIRVMRRNPKRFRCAFRILSFLYKSQNERFFVDSLLLRPLVALQKIGRKEVAKKKKGKKKKR